MTPSAVLLLTVQLAGAPQAPAKSPAPPAVPTVKPPAPAPPAAPSGDCAVRSSVDRTAVWIADRVTYTIDFTCRSGVDMLADDLAREKLNLDGLTVIGNDTADLPAADGKVLHRYRYVLTTYQVDVPTLTIAPMTVRYVSRRPGQRLEDAQPAGEIRVPGALVAFRSVLPDDRDVAAIRDLRSAGTRPAIFTMMRTVGIGLVIVSIVPVLLATVAFVRQRRAPRPRRRSMRSVRQESRSGLDAVRSGDLTTLEGRREAFSQIDAIVREHVRAAFNIPGPSLASSEIGPALAAAGVQVPVETLTEVLSTCERARYGPPDQMPSSEVCRENIDRAEQLVAKRG